MTILAAVNHTLVAETIGTALKAGRATAGTWL
jgi:hypothetical protein